MLGNHILCKFEFEFLVNLFLNFFAHGPVEYE